MGTHTPAQLPLRERKKLRTRQALEDAALRLFLDNGFDATTLDELVDAAEVSKRTFFRNYSGKEQIALAAEIELWDAYVAEIADRDVDGALLDFLRESMLAALRGLGEEWNRRFIATRGLIARTPALRERSLVLSVTASERIVGALEEKLGIDGRYDVRLRLLGEFALSAWRCGAKNWVAGRGYADGSHGVGSGGISTLVERVDEAFEAVPDALRMPGSA